MEMENLANGLEDIFVHNRVISYQSSLEASLAKVTQIFAYENLPLTIPAQILEEYLTQYGSAVVYKFEDELFVSKPELKGELDDIYGRPTQATVDRFGKRYQYRIGVDAVLVQNDSRRRGLMPLLQELAVYDSQIKITMLQTLVNLRTNTIIEAKDEKSRRSAEEFERQIRQGELAILTSNSPLQGLESIAVHNTPMPQGTAEQVVAISQYILAKYYSELGININNDMKSQYVSETEIERTTGLPLVNDMLKCRLESVRDINALFDQDIDVNISKPWGEEPDDEEQSLDLESGDTGEPSNEPTEQGEPVKDEDQDSDSSQESQEQPNEDIQGSRTDVEDEEVEEATREEVIEATEATQSEEVEDTDPVGNTEEGVDDDEEDGEDSDARSESTETESSEDEEPRDDVQSEDDREG